MTRNLTNKQARMFAKMYVAGLAFHHTLTIDLDLGDNDVDNITHEINKIVYRITPSDNILASTDEILNYVRINF